MKFLIKLASFVVCVGILGFGGYQTVQEMKIEEMLGEIESALESAPVLPDFGGNEDPDNPDNPDQGGNDQGGNDQGGNDQGGNDQGGNDQGGNDQGGNDQGGNDQGGNDQGGNDQGGNDQGGNDQGGNDQGGNDQGGNDQPENPPTLSTDSAVDALGGMYDNNDPEFNDMNREFFVGMVEGFLTGNSGSGDSGSEDNPPAEDPDFDNNFDGDFGEDFNPDEFVPEEEPEDPEDEEQNEMNEIILDVAGTYYENLQAGIQQNIEANAGATEEEQQAARDEFVQQEAEAFAGLINIATRPEETTEDQLVQSVDAVINSSVCLDTVTESINNNEDLSTTVQDATANMNEETKAEIESKLNEAIASNPEKEQQYNDLANLFGITLGAEGTPVIPDGVNPDDYPF
ncbi:MAG: hypothetical protein IKJ25_00850 [Clostridia bacterium]|nr:hypothetical protein [Clostridia bacterium]